MMTMNNHQCLKHLVDTAASPNTIVTIEIWELRCLLHAIAIAKDCTCGNDKEIALALAPLEE